jgi:diacylglycerol kinase (ATP)
VDSCGGNLGSRRRGRRAASFGGRWCWIILAISIVWTAEALNTAFEFLADAASPEFHPLVRDAKDVAAGAVLITAGAAAVIGGIVFWPYFLK